MGHRCGLAALGAFGVARLEPIDIRVANRQRRAKSGGAVDDIRIVGRDALECGSCIVGGDDDFGQRCGSAMWVGDVGGGGNFEMDVERIGIFEATGPASAPGHQAWGSGC